MISEQKQHLCVECGTQFKGCKVFNGYIRITDFCSEECMNKFNKDCDDE